MRLEKALHILETHRRELRDPLDFLRDIGESCIRIADYTAGLSRDEVFTDKMLGVK